VKPTKGCNRNVPDLVVLRYDLCGAVEPRGQWSNRPGMIVGSQAQTATGLVRRQAAIGSSASSPGQSLAAGRARSFKEDGPDGAVTAWVRLDSNGSAGLWDRELLAMTQEE
jgi:hypothetical protein